MDPLSAGASGGMGGILTVLIQGGSFALLCFIVYWLTRWVPKRVERNDALRETEAKSREAVAESLRKVTEIQAAATVEAVKEANRTHAEQLKYEREECAKNFRDIMAKHEALMRREDERHEEVMDKINRQYEISREIRHEVAGIAQSRANERILQEHQRLTGGRKSPHPQPPDLKGGQTA